MFVGRKTELESLAKLWRRNLSSLVVIKGRRRIGKSRLIEEFAAQSQPGTLLISLTGLAPTPGVKAQTQRDEFARQIGRIFQVPPPFSQDWGDLFWQLAHHTQTGKTIVFLDEISWMGMKSATFLGQLKSAWDMHFSKNPQLIMVLCGSVSSWIEKNILKSTGFVGRMTLVLSLQQLTLPECDQFWGKQGQHIWAYEKFKVLAVTGGVPRYLENIVPQVSAEELIHDLCFKSEGLLFREFNNIFHDLFTNRSEIYLRILKCLIKKPHASLQELFTLLELNKTGVLSSYLADLEMAGFLKRRFAWDLKSGKTNQKSRFSISDNYVRFYLKYIEPQLDSIERGAFLDRPLATLPGWDTIMGLSFENLVIQNRQALYQALRVSPAEIINDGPYFQKQTLRKSGCQIDYLIQTKYNNLILCEIKFSKNPIGPSVIPEVKKKMDILRCERSFSVRPVLIHVNGVEDELYGQEFFAEMINFSQFLPSSK